MMPSLFLRSAARMAHQAKPMPQLFAQRSSLLSAPVQNSLKSLPTQAISAASLNKNLDFAQKRTLFSWGLRPYAWSAAAGTGVGLSSINAGFSKVSLSLLVCPWKALPTALIILPMAWAVPALMRTLYTNSSRSGTASFFQVWQGMAVMFMGMPVKLAGEHMFGEMTFYGLMLFGTYFLYNFFPELVLNDFIFSLFTALFILPLFAFAFNALPLYAPRAFMF